VLILACGAYGMRMGEICQKAKIPYDLIPFLEDKSVGLDERVERCLATGDYGSLAVVHCETTSGLLNPMEDIGERIKSKHPNVFYIVDAMSSFGGVVANYENVDFLVSSANKCLQGVPGFAFVICKKESLLQCKGECHSHTTRMLFHQSWIIIDHHSSYAYPRTKPLLDRSMSLSLDLYDQWMGFERNGQFRFTPPTHCILGFKKAIEELEEEGGVIGRSTRYLKWNIFLNWRIWLLIIPCLSSAIIPPQVQTEQSHFESRNGKTWIRSIHWGQFGWIHHHFLQVSNTSKFSFWRILWASQRKGFIKIYFYSRPFNIVITTLPFSQLGQLIYPGKLTNADCFRIGNIGHLFPSDMQILLECIQDILKEMKIQES